MSSPYITTVTLATPLTVLPPGNPFGTPIVATQAAVTEISMTGPTSAGRIEYVLLDANGNAVPNTNGAVGLTGATALSDFASIVNIPALQALWVSLAGISVAAS